MEVSHVLVDTNILPQKGNLNSLFWQSLKKICVTRGIVLSVPEIVMHEAVNMRKEMADKWAQELLESHRNLTRFVELDPVYVPGAEEVSDAWERQIRDYFAILPSDGDDALEALVREAHRRPPAREGRGARDSLIWLTAARLARTGAHVALISENTKDFGMKGEMHPNLVREIADIDGEVTYFSNANVFVSTVADEVARPKFGEDEAWHALSSAAQNAAIDLLGLEKYAELSVDEVFNSKHRFSAINTPKAYVIEGKGIMRVSGYLEVSHPDTGAVYASGEFSSWVSFDPATGNVDESDFESLEGDFGDGDIGRPMAQPPS